MSLERGAMVSRFHAASVLIVCTGFVAGNCVHAQGDVVFDNFTVSELADDVNLAIDPGGTFNITEDFGQRAGNNLFHSFHSFNIENGETALFTGDASIVSIISRVTGGSASLIDGTLRSEIPGAGFWLVNPTGLILGPNSSIDVGGAFNFGAADFISFADDLRFSAVDESVTLSVASPREFGFLSDGGGSGVLALNNIELGAAPSPGIESYNGLLYVGREVSVNDSTVRTLGEGVAQGDIEIFGGSITIRNSRLITTTNSATNAGAITVNGSEIAIVGDTELTTETTGTGDAGAISIVATDTVTSLPVTVINQFSGEESEQGPFISAGSYDPDAGAAGNITIRGGTINLSNAIVASVSQTDQTVNDTSLVLLDATNGDLALTNILLSTTTAGAADGGSITLVADNVVMRNASLESITEDQQTGLGAGAAGSVQITGTTRVTMASASGVEWSIRAASQLLESGQAGNVVIQGGTIDLSGGSIRSFTDSRIVGHVPALVLIDSDGNDLRLSNMVVETSTRGVNDAGLITLAGGDVSLLNETLIVSDSTTISYPSSGVCGGTVCTSATEIGAAGRISITGESVNLQNSAVAATTEAFRVGNSPGTVAIFASMGDVDLVDSSVVTSTTGASDAGQISLAAENILLDSSSILSQATNTGAAGEIAFNTSENLTISAARQFDSEVRSDAVQSAGGDILVTAGGRFSIRNGAIEASAGAAGNGGDVEVTADSFVIQSSAILAQADGGDGGAIEKNVEGADLIFIMDAQSVINADSASGQSGDITVNAPDIDLDSALQEQDANIVAAPQLAADACSPSATGAMSTFVQDDEGGTPASPDRYLSAVAQTHTTAAAALAPDNTHPDELRAAVQINPRELCR